MNIWAGDIGSNPHEVEFEPFPEQAPAEPIRQPSQPSTPAREPEKVPVPA